MPTDFWTWYWAFCSFVFGAVTGSFLNVCVWRLPRNKSLSHPPSHCPSCEHRLQFFPDMVPLLSQAWYRSRCRYCGTPFSWRYFWVELFTAVCFVGCYYRYGVFAPYSFGDMERTLSVLAAMMFVAAMITVFFIDLEHYLIPDSVILFAVLMAVGRDGFLIWKGVRPLWQEVPGVPFLVPLPLSILGGLLAFWALWQFAALATAALGREAMGAGDSLLIGAMGAFLIPWPLVLVAFLLAVLLGALGGVAGLWFSSRAPAGASVGAGERSCPPGGETNDSSQPAPGEHLSGHRGMALADDAADAVPPLPPGSRWGRLWSVLGTWLAVAALWAGAAQGAGVGIALALPAVVLLVFGVRQWVRGDRVWLPAMDELFEDGDPGPRFIPFGPYLVAGTFLAMAVGRPLVEWYAGKVLGLTLHLPWD